MLVLPPSYLASCMSWFQRRVDIQVLTPPLQNTCQVIQLTFGKLFTAGPDCSSFQSISSRMNKNVPQLKPTLSQQNYNDTCVRWMISLYFIFWNCLTNWHLKYMKYTYTAYTEYKYTWTGVWTVCYYTGLLGLDQIQKPSTQCSSDIYSC